jgi:hypothetical protein
MFLTQAESKQALEEIQEFMHMQCMTSVLELQCVKILHRLGIIERKNIQLSSYAEAFSLS